MVFTEAVISSWTVLNMVIISLGLTFIMAPSGFCGWPPFHPPLLVWRLTDIPWSVVMSVLFAIQQCDPIQLNILNTDASCHVIVTRHRIWIAN
jgi:hypothetical protein